MRISYRTHVDADGNVETPEPSYSTVRSELPKTVTGEVSDGNGGTHQRRVPVMLTRVRDQKTACMTSSNPFFSTPGGIPMYCLDTNNGGTFCASFDHDNYGQGTIGSGHVCDVPNAECEVDLQTVGYVDDYNDGLDIDWAFVNDDAQSVTSQIVDGNGGNAGEDVSSSIVTDAALNNDVGTSKTYYTQGEATCRTSCTLEALNGFGTSWGRWTTSVQNGDSGGPVFIDEGSTVSIAGVIVSNYNGDCKATTAETIQNKANGAFF